MRMTRSVPALGGTAGRSWGMPRAQSRRCGAPGGGAMPVLTVVGVGVLSSGRHLEGGGEGRKEQPVGRLLVRGIGVGRGWVGWRVIKCSGRCCERLTLPKCMQGRTFAHAAMLCYCQAMGVRATKLRALHRGTSYRTREPSQPASQPTGSTVAYSLRLLHAAPRGWRSVRCAGSS